MPQFSRVPAEELANRAVPTQRDRCGCLGWAFDDIAHAFLSREDLVVRGKVSHKRLRTSQRDGSRIARIAILCDSRHSGRPISVQSPSAHKCASPGAGAPCPTGSFGLGETPYNQCRVDGFLKSKVACCETIWCRAPLSWGRWVPNWLARMGKRGK